jgi:serine protease
MRHPLLTLAAVCALLAPMTLRAPQAQAATAPTAATAATPLNAPARVIVKFKEGTALARKQALSLTTASQVHAERAQELGQRVGIALKGGAGIAERTQVMTARGMSSAQLAARLAKEGDVEYAVVDKRRHVSSMAQTPNDPLFASVAGSQGPAVGQWYLKAPTANAAVAIGDIVSGINAPGAWDLTTGTSSVVVAVIDTGVRFDHPDLTGRFYPGYDFISDVATANDGDGRDADPSDPGDWITQAESDDANGQFKDCGASDSSWHGTQVSGIIGAATHNQMGMASVGRNVMLLPVRVLGKCGGYDSDIIAGMRWAAGLSVPGVPANTHPAKVLNLSLGGDGACDVSTGYPDAVAQINAAGAVIVASAGNSAGHAVAVPANCSGVIGVTGLRHVGTKVGFSDLGPEISISAPGGNCVNTTAGSACLYPILTTSNAGTTTPVVGTGIYTDSFNSSLGTSFSAPLVSGAAALVLSIAPNSTPAQVRSFLMSTARPFPTTGGDVGAAPGDAPVQQCVAPHKDPSGNFVDQLQCYCTTSLCGAGMLDVSAAVHAADTAAVPTAPLVSSSANPSVGASVTLDGSSASPITGRTIAAYQWSMSGSGGATIADPTAAVTTLTATAAGTVTVTLTVTDSVGATTSRSTVLAISSAPTAVIAPSATTTSVGTPITLDGSGSTASSGRSIATYTWAITSGGSLATLSATSGASVTLTPTGTGSVTVMLTVTDSAGVSGSTSTTLTLTAAPVSSGGGGGALGWQWLLALAAAVVALRRSARRGTV